MVHRRGHGNGVAFAFQRPSEQISGASHVPVDCENTRHHHRRMGRLSRKQKHSNALHGVPEVDDLKFVS